ncbi:MAG: GSCFA domain-containing protein [Flavobacteriales bacterium]
MESFRTEFKLERSDSSIKHSSKTLLIGSCFAQEMGLRMKTAGFQTNLNSHGILFNPISIKNSLEDIIKCKTYAEKDLYHYANLWHSFNHHGSFSGTDVHNVLENINSTIRLAHKDLLNTDTLILTFGSAWIYEWAESGKVVANCHKVPQRYFNKRKLGVNEIISELSSAFDRITDLNPRIKIILTISPVRYLKEGFVENNWSKATLNIAVHELIRRFDCTSYFPAYELVIDDLRDYRFYKEDMTHPSKQAVDYVWGRFASVYFSESTLDIITKVERIKKATQHRTLHAESPQSIGFQEKILKEKEELKSQYPFLEI